MVRTIEAYHNIHLRLAQSRKFVGLFHDSPLALSECIFLEARGRTGHTRSLPPAPTLTIFSVHEARSAGFLTASTARLQQCIVGKNPCVDVAPVHRFAERVRRQVMRTCIMHSGIQTLLLSSIFDLAECMRTPW